MEENLISREDKEDTSKSKKKRGRKPSKERKGYFYEREESAVAQYISTEDADEKDRIYNTVLRPAFTKMIEAIIRRYNLYPPDEEFQETFDDTMSFLMTKLSKFNPSKNHKAYSYCGTICKNYLIYKINHFSKNQKRNSSYDGANFDVRDGLMNSLRYSYDETDSGNSFISELTGTTVENIRKILEDKEKSRLSRNEELVGQALIQLMTNWEELFAQMGSNKFNKSSILLYLKETTMLGTKEIRDALKMYKKKYYEIKLGLIND